MSEFGSLNREWQDFHDQLVATLPGIWLAARGEVLGASQVDADSVFHLTDPAHLGDPAVRADQAIHQHVHGQLARLYPNIVVVGEEARPRSLLLDPARFNLIAQVDALDGSKQAFALAGGWSTVVVLQQYLGASLAGPDLRTVAVVVVAAEGVAVSAVSGVRAAFVTPLLPEDIPGTVFSDQVVVSDGSSGGVFEETIVVTSGYKPTWREAHVAVLSACHDLTVFDAAGSPATLKALLNDDVVVVQPLSSALWDGAASYLIAKAGGFVIPVGSLEPLHESEVFGWFDQLGWHVEEGQLASVLQPVPPFVAGMNFDRVCDVAARLARTGAADTLLALGR
jgi:fructose-1,6-bisphosphatase/inositol monophosphatase family enzyme